MSGLEWYSAGVWLPPAFSVLRTTPPNCCQKAPCLLPPSPPPASLPQTDCVSVLICRAELELQYLECRSETEWGPWGGQVCQNRSMESLCKPRERKVVVQVNSLGGQTPSSVFTHVEFREQKKCK